MKNNNKEIYFDPDNPPLVGGQAVIEGVMMRAPGRIVTAVRRSNDEIVVKKKDYVSLGNRFPIFRLPIIRGVIGLLEMLFIGIESLNFSADIAMHDIAESEHAKKNGETTKKKKHTSKFTLALTVIIAIVLGTSIFLVIPLFITTQLFNIEQNAFWFNIISGLIRLSILLIYLIAISQIKDIKRIFEYHGAEHKSVFAFESQSKLNIDTVIQFSRFHPRCGTSFLLIVMIASIILFSVLDSLLIFLFRETSFLARVISHIPLVPFIGGLAYEFIRWSARHIKTPIGKLLIAPGLWLQRITTREPDKLQIEVAIVSLRYALGAELIGIKKIDKLTELAST